MRIVLADTQQKIRSALRLMLEHHRGFYVVGEAVRSGDLLAEAKDDCPDVVLLDWDLPGMPLENLLRALKEFCPDLRVIVLGGRPEVQQAAIDAGGDDFVSKADPPDRLLEALLPPRKDEE